MDSHKDETPGNVSKEFEKRSLADEVRALEWLREMYPHEQQIGMEDFDLAYIEEELEEFDKD